MRWSKRTLRQRTGSRHQDEFKRSHVQQNRSLLLTFDRVDFASSIKTEIIHLYDFPVIVCVSPLPLIKYHYCFADISDFVSCLNHTIVPCWFWVLVPMVTAGFRNSKGQLCLKEAWTFPMCLEIDCTILDKVIIKIFLSSLTPVAFIRMQHFD